MNIWTRLRQWLSEASSPLQPSTSSEEHEAWLRLMTEKERENESLRREWQARVDYIERERSVMVQEEESK